MSSLYWAIQWDWGLYTIDNAANDAIVSAIRQRTITKQVSEGDIGKYLQNIPVVIENSQTSFSARLEKIHPLLPLVVDNKTEFQIRLVSDLDNPTPLSKDNALMGPSLTRDLEELVTFHTVFDPRHNGENHYLEIYNSLVGIPKDSILREMVGLLTPFEIKENWSKRHYGHIIPAVRSTANKAPVIVLGGDPGTGKTALSTSIGARLSLELVERVHFHHLSMMLRGMGYQGRASSIIVKLFEHITQEYNINREPIILFFDEAEAIVGARGETDSSSGAQENIAIVDSIIVGVDSLRKGIQARIIALFATNLTERIDPALLRRSYYHHFNRPDNSTRFQLFRNALSGTDFSEIELRSLVEATAPNMVNGIEVEFTPSDIVELIIGRAMNEAIAKDKPISLNLLLDYCSRVRPTRSLSRYDK